MHRLSSVLNLNNVLYKEWMCYGWIIYIYLIKNSVVLFKKVLSDSLIFFKMFHFLFIISFLFFNLNSIFIFWKRQILTIFVFLALNFSISGQNLFAMYFISVVIPVNSLDFFLFYNQLPIIYRIQLKISLLITRKPE